MATGAQRFFKSDDDVTFQVDRGDVELGQGTEGGLGECGLANVPGMEEQDQKRLKVRPRMFTPASIMTHMCAYCYVNVT